MLMNTWSVCIKMNILLMSVGLIVLSPLNTWCGSDVHFTLDMECDLQVVGSWATWGFFYTPWNTHRHLCQGPPKIIVSSHLGSLEVYLGVYLCVFSGKLWKREKIIWRSLTCVFSRRGLMYDLHFFWFWDKLRTILLISCFFFNIEINLWL